MPILIIYFTERWVGQGFVCFSDFDELLLRGVIAPTKENPGQILSSEIEVLQGLPYGFLSG
jgi:hypothetical protein